MGIRSDVGIALKAGPILDALKSHPLLVGADDVQKEAEGTLFIIEDIKWYVHYDEEIIDLYTRLDALDPTGDNHYIVTACSEFPESDDGDSGRWDENPWGLCRCATAYLSTYDKAYVHVPSDAYEGLRNAFRALAYVAAYQAYRHAEAEAPHRIGAAAEKLYETAYEAARYLETAQL